MSEPIEIRYASTDDDVIAIHRFLCIVAAPFLPGPIDGKDSAVEVWKVAHESVALMAMRGDVLIGTMGLVRPCHWWNPKLPYLANRWLFAIPGAKAWMPLVREAQAIAVASELELQIISEERGKVITFNRSPYRNWNQPALANSPNSSLALATYAA